MGVLTIKNILRMVVDAASVLLRHYKGVYCILHYYSTYTPLQGVYYSTRHFRGVMSIYYSTSHESGVYTRLAEKT